MAQLFDLSGGQSGPIPNMAEPMSVPTRYTNSVLEPIDPSAGSRYNDGDNGERGGREGGRGAAKYNVTDKLKSHIENVDISVPRKKGIGGAHNKDIFLQNDVKIISETPNPKIHGVSTIEYQMPKFDKTGTLIPGEYQSGVPKVKTIYDPNALSTDEYLNRGLQAANNVSGQYPDGVLPREWVGMDNQGVAWRGYYENGQITSLFPE